MPTTAVTVDKIQSSLEDRVLNWTQGYCESLMENYRLKYPDSHSDKKYEIETGRKYHKIVMSDLSVNGERWSQGVHAFVNKKTGEVYKPASWKAPAKHVRYDLRSIKQRRVCFSNADWAGGYLYLRG